MSASVLAGTVESGVVSEEKGVEVVRGIQVGATAVVESNVDVRAPRSAEPQAARPKNSHKAALRSGDEAGAFPHSRPHTFVLTRSVAVHVCRRRMRQHSVRE